MIRYGHLLSLYQSSVWAIDPMTLEAFGRGLHMAMRGEIRAADPVRVAPAPASVGVAVIPMFGAIGKYMSQMELDCVGGCDLNRVSATLRAAIDNPEVDAVLLHINSPGGVVTGTPEFASLVKELSKKKPIYAYTDQMMASAAYWIGAACNAIIASPSASVGSIGVYMALVDQSRYLDKKGIDVHLIRAGRLKGLGMPGTWNDEAAAHLQASVDEVYENFTGWVRQMRGNIADDTMQGQTFSAVRARELGLIDDVMNSVEDVLSGIALAHNQEGR
jgi:protease-4